MFRVLLLAFSVSCGLTGYVIMPGCMLCYFGYFYYARLYSVVVRVMPLSLVVCCGITGNAIMPDCMLW